MRTDIHCPKNINPADYEFVGVEYRPRLNENWLAHEAHVKALLAHVAGHMEKTGGVWASHEHGGSCMVCGAHALYTAVYYHAASNEYIRTGFDCAAKMDMTGPDAHRVFKNTRSMITGLREAKAGKEKAANTLMEAGALLAWDLYCDNANTEDGGIPDVSFLVADAKFTTMDIVRKLIRYGDISDKAMGYLKKTMVWAAEAVALKALDTHADEFKGFLDPEMGPECFGVLADHLEGSGEVSDRLHALGKYMRYLNGPKGERYLAEMARVENAADCPTGKAVDIEGTVLSLKEDVGYYGTTYKMLVESVDGFRVYGTVPSSIYSVRRGDAVTFRAGAVESSKDDPKFGFFKRPTRAAIVKECEEELAHA